MIHRAHSKPQTSALLTVFMQRKITSSIKHAGKNPAFVK